MRTILTSVITAVAACLGCAVAQWPVEPPASVPAPPEREPAPAPPLSDAPPEAMERRAVLGWHVNVGDHSSRGRERCGSVVPALFEPGVGWRLDPDSNHARVLEILRRYPGNPIRLIHFHHPHGVWNWYKWREDQRTTMRFEQAAIARRRCPELADLDALVSMFNLPGEQQVGFYIGSPRCAEMGWSGFEADTRHADEPGLFLGEMLSHDPLYIALDALAGQTKEGGPWVRVRDYIAEHGAAAMAEPNIGRGRSDMDEIGLFTGWRNYLNWKDLDWTRPLDEIGGPVIVSTAHAPIGRGPGEFASQNAPGAMQWRWDATFEALAHPDVDYVVAPLHVFEREGYDITILLRYAQGGRKP